VVVRKDVPQTQSDQLGDFLLLVDRRRFVFAAHVLERRFRCGSSAVVPSRRLAQQRLEELQEFCANYLQESKDGGTDGGDYGIIPGAGKKKVLFKSGAEKLCDVYGLAGSSAGTSPKQFMLDEREYVRDERGTVCGDR
jgi:hypothetical protein